MRVAEGTEGTEGTEGRGGVEEFRLKGIIPLALTKVGFAGYDLA